MLMLLSYLFHLVYEKFANFMAYNCPDMFCVHPGTHVQTPAGKVRVQTVSIDGKQVMGSLLNRVRWFVSVSNNVVQLGKMIKAWHDGTMDIGKIHITYTLEVPQEIEHDLNKGMFKVGGGCTAEAKKTMFNNIFPAAI